MGDLVPPPSTGVPAVQDRKGGTMDFTSVWRKWFIDLTEILNKSGGVTGSVSPSRAVNTTAPLTGGGDLTEDRTITFEAQAVHKVLAGPAAGLANAVPTFRVLVTEDLPGISGTVVLVKVTALGTNGSLTFENGNITSFVAPT